MEKLIRDITIPALVQRVDRVFQNLKKITKVDPHLIG